MLRKCPWWSAGQLCCFSLFPIIATWSQHCRSPGDSLVYNRRTWNYELCKHRIPSTATEKFHQQLSKICFPGEEKYNFSSEWSSVTSIHVNSAETDKKRTINWSRSSICSKNNLHPSTCTVLTFWCGGSRRFPRSGAACVSGWEEVRAGGFQPWGRCKAKADRGFFSLSLCVVVCFLRPGASSAVCSWDGPHCRFHDGPHADAAGGTESCVCHYF